MKNTGIFWFVGLFTLVGPIVVGLYINALPYKSTSAGK